MGKSPAQNVGGIVTRVYGKFLALYKGVGLTKIILILAAVWLVIFGGIYLYLNFYKGGGDLKITTLGTAPMSRVRPTPNPYKLPRGAQSYTITSGKDVKGPKITNVVIDPLDPKNGTKQTFKVTVESPVTSAAVTVHTDNKETNVDLKLVSGDSTKGVYQGSWIVDDSYDYVYAFTYVIKGPDGVYDNTMFLRQ